MTPNQVHKKYKSRIFRIFRDIASVAKSEGLSTSAIDNMSDEEHSYSMVLGKNLKNPSPRDADVTFTILEEAVREGEGKGVAFSMSATRRGGEMIGGMTPGNYSKDLWVSDSADIEERFRMFESADPNELIALIKES